MTQAIEVIGLRKGFGEVQALTGLDLTAPSGSIQAMLGPNGAGKTTAVRVLATLARPDSGIARVCGFDTVMDAGRVRGVIGLTGQFASVDEDLTGTENLVMIGRLMALGRTAARRRSAELLDLFGLTDAASRKVSTYSGGMRRRLDLAASLVAEPAVVFLDEPTTGLDPGAREDMWAVIRRLVAGGTTILLTTQYLEEADTLADHIVVLDHGSVIARGTPPELKRLVGGQMLSIRPVDPARLPDVESILARLSSGGVTAPCPGVLRVAVSDDSVLTAAVSLLRTAAVEVSELSLHLPSLDEVFLTLTRATPGAA